MDNVEVTIFSRKMRDDLYSKRRLFEEYQDLTQEQEMERVKRFLIDIVNISEDAIKMILTDSFDNTLIVNKQGQVFKASNMNSNFYLIENLKPITGDGYTNEEVEQIGKINFYLAQETNKRFQLAFPNYRSFKGYGQLKPYMHHSEAPSKAEEDWPVYKKETCARKHCHRLANSHCGHCKAVHYCSRPCQVSDWHNGHAGSCKKCDK